jgi:N-acetylneuraminic acid mutarotase
VQVYDPVTDSWRLGPPLPVALNHSMAAGVGGRLYVIGGQTNAGGAGPFVNTTYELDPVRGVWTTRAPMPTARSGGGCAVIDDKIYVAGGRPPRGSDFAVYEPATDRWTPLPPLPTQRNHVGVAAAGGQVYVVGGRFEAGFESPMTDRVEVFDPSTGSWRVRRPLPRPRGGVNAVTALGLVHVFGGEGNPDVTSGVFPDHDVYDPARDLWVRLAAMPTPVHGVTGASFLRGVIHLTGGGVSLGGASGSLIHQVYRPRAMY